ncbi:hypothetical protein Dsin_021610 [Dipteronia sinensis]|uniref:DNA-directed RNA polymerase subunit n=1 Tax=Dipteronia sinensis TaxID=43782 RepID=A0AAD9ZZZ6_9ROSI|nr:hypothetical protein Dsin_021610 [Dipteronia sinensis]
MEGLKVSDANLVAYVHPSKSNNISQAILRELSFLLFKFSEILEGVVLAYDVNILDKNANLLSGIHPYFGVRLKANLLLFSPKPNMLLGGLFRIFVILDLSIHNINIRRVKLLLNLYVYNCHLLFYHLSFSEGKVVKLTQESIHVIVLGFSSAIIIDEDIRDEFKYNYKHGEELFASRSNKRHKIKVGTMIRFLVKSFDEEILHISGSLIPAHTGSIRWLDKNSEDVSLTDRSTRKRREGEGETEIQENETLGGVASSLSNGHQTKKSKKRRFAEDH